VRVVLSSHTPAFSSFSSQIKKSPSLLSTLRVPACAFSTVPPQKAPFDTKKAPLDNNDMQTLLERDGYLKVKNKIEAEKRRVISMTEFQGLCSEEGLSKEQTKRLCQSLSDAGTILYFPNSGNAKLQESVFLKPEELNSTVHHLLSHYSPTALNHKAEAIEADIAATKQELAPLEKTREELDERAHRRANLIVGLGLGYCVVQFLAIGRLTWWELSWDVMEPVTYMLTFGTALIGYSWFLLTGSEYTYEGLKKTLRDRKLKKLIRSTGFDETRFRQLSQALDIKERRLAKILDDIHHIGLVPPPPPPQRQLPGKDIKAPVSPNNKEAVAAEQVSS